jgi:excisionase family DNA binding protein
MQTMLTIQDVAERLKVTTMTVRRWWYQGRLPKPMKIGGATRWREQDIQEWMDNGCPQDTEHKEPSHV